MFKQRHKNSVISQVLKAAVEHNRKLTIDTFIEMGKYFLSITHEVKGYQNQTYNLSSSKGFVVFDNGKKIAEGGFEAAGPFATTGPQRGRILAEKEAPKKGISLVIVAGERYAAAVEAKGKNVLTMESLEMDVEVRKLVSKMK